MIGLTRLFSPLLSLRRILPILWLSSRRWTLWGSGLMLLEVGCGLAVLYLLKQLVDVVTQRLGPAAMEGSATIVLGYVALTGIVSLAYLTARSLSALAREAQGLYVAEHIDREIHAAAVRVDLAFYESPRYHDTLERARAAGNQRPVQVISNLMMLAKNILLLAAVSGLIVTLSPLLLPLLLVAILPALVARLRFNRELFVWQRKRTQMERRSGYLDWLMTSEINAKELRLNQLGDFFRHQYARLRAELRRERLAITARRTRIELLVSWMATLAFFSAMGLLAWRTSEGYNSVGDLVLFLLIFQRVQAMGQELVQQLAKLYEDHLYLGLLFDFLDLEPVLLDPVSPRVLPEPLQEGVRFERVSFHYPGCEGEVLSDVSLAIRPGQVVALVGANGSGKTSLIKLLCRLYDPSRGRITLDGVDIREFGLDDYRCLFSVIFQDYSHYAATARDNIRYGDIHEPEGSPRVEEAASLSGAAPLIEALPAGYDTPLTRIFDEGQELSIGQWQKVALARAFMRRSSIIILDEPTSALDPGAEFTLFENFRERIEHRAALIISHRLSTVRMADVIYVMEDGKISEVGDHDALMFQRGHYWRLFSQQAHYYRETNDEGCGPEEKRENEHLQ
ncbi:ABC transporter ATP-binding protein [Halomonas sp. DQ26W]|uniref:ABC transporter ATP-binding protein n=1 Tax=Halomonas sp. DQ26W TaxID=2282311 RepID=UPI000DF75922|nr:ABC transporter ATP-binding protein [Halomonas sp. DQ26W]RDB44390.1 ABC transporter ATP-binding protein [Halomonas sp. DQ26W]